MNSDLSYGEALALQFPEREFRYYPETGSTNREAWRMAEGGAPHGTLIVADSQTDGRGRLDRKWVSPGGVNIYFSLVLRPEIPLAVAPLVGLAASLAVARSVGFHVKWPNDVVDVHGKKAAGVLSEVHTAEGQVDFLILGIGLNVNQTRFDPELSNATSLKLHREVDIERVGLLRSIVSSLDAWVPTVWLARDRLLGTWQRHCSMMGHEVRVEGVTGRAIDLRSDGALLIETLSGQIVPVLTGDVESGGLR